MQYNDYIRGRLHLGEKRYEVEVYMGAPPARDYEAFALLDKLSVQAVIEITEDYTRLVLSGGLDGVQSVVEFLQKTYHVLTVRER